MINLIIPAPSPAPLRAGNYNRLIYEVLPFENEQMIPLGCNNDLVRNARAVQNKLKAKHPCGRKGREIRVTAIGGADASYDGDTGIGVIAVLSFPGLRPIGHTVSVRKVLFPYVPGLFAFRELPLYLAAYEKLGVYPDLLLVNGHGYSHPKRFGLACQAGAQLDTPTIGIASRLLCGRAVPPGPKEGSFSPVTDGQETIGMSVRTREGKKPIFVSAGYQTDLRFAVEMTLASTAAERIPLPIRAADSLARAYRRNLPE
jgi:deoxyribonuclease V